MNKDILVYSKNIKKTNMVEVLNKEFVETIFNTYCPTQSQKIVNKEAIYPLLIEKLKEVNDRADGDGFLILIDEEELDDYELKYVIAFAEMICLYPFVQGIYRETYDYGYLGWFDDVVDSIIEEYTDYYIERLEIVKREETEKWEKSCQKLSNFCKAHNIKPYDTDRTSIYI